MSSINRTRAQNYPSLNMLADAVVHQFTLMKEQGQVLAPEAEAYLAACQQVKLDYPKNTAE